jgi:hypothetical protein
MQPEFIFAQQFNDKVLPLIADTHLSIDVVIFDWRFDTKEEKSAIQAFNFAIIHAIGRGVKVRAIVNNASVAERLNQLGARAKVFNSHKLLHTKLLILDKKFVVVGSHNYTESALTSNYEVSVLVEMLNEQNLLATYFDNLWSY